MWQVISFIMLLVLNLKAQLIIGSLDFDQSIHRRSILNNARLGLVENIIDVKTNEKKYN